LSELAAAAGNGSRFYLKKNRRVNEMSEREDLQAMELYAWVGWDELSTGGLGLKQGVVPAGVIPIVSVDRAQIEKYWDQAEVQAEWYGKRIFLARFRLVEVVRETSEGKP
jgi:hypothetical protein